MKFRLYETFCVVCLAISVAFAVPACTKGAPAAPSESSEEPPPPPAPVPPLIPILAFTPETTRPTGQSVGIVLASDVHPEGTIGLAIYGYGLKNDHGGKVRDGGLGVQRILGRVRWDGALLELVGAQVGDVRSLRGAPARSCVPGVSSQAEQGHTLGWCAEWPPPQPLPAGQPAQIYRAFGDGEIFRFRLKPREGVAEGTSSIRFVEGWDGAPQERVVIFPSFGAKPDYQRLDHYYGGAITITPQ